MEFTPQNTGQFRDDFSKAVEDLEKQYGCSIELGTIRYESLELRAKMTARIGEKREKLPSSDFTVGEVVFIDHPKVSNIETFEILKVNRKTIRLRSRDTNRTFNVSPSFLKKN
tara:strand:- start:468 stop:806 length:339 start_codon:yes stop_codon:yes gene_type:complete